MGSSLLIMINIVLKDIVIEPQEEKIDIYTKYGAYFDEGEYLMYEAFYKIPLNSHSLSVIAVFFAASIFFCKNSAYYKYTKKEEKILENGVEIIGTIITDVDRNAEKIVLPKYVEGTLYRELSGAMRRRCGYLYIPKKTREEIIEILKNNAKVNDKVAAGIASCIVSLQEESLKHPVSISEAVDWANFLRNDANKVKVMNSIGLLAKDRRDMGIIRKTVESYAGVIAG